MQEETLYTIAVTLLPNVGAINGKRLITHCGSAQEVFREKKTNLMKIQGVSNGIIDGIGNREILLRAEKEMQFIERNNIRAISFFDNNYPIRLKRCADGPVILYVRGNTLPMHNRMLAIVGTRNATDYGRQMCEKIISEITDYNVGIISGLAYGIDTEAHKNSLKYRLDTFAVLGHGLQTVYPAKNSSLARSIESNGSLISEFISGTNPDRENFPQRNRIIAGLSDAVLIVEAAEKGGALITAYIAQSYNRDIFAIPGRINDKYSIGCNNLIKRQQAYIILSGKDIIENMNWDDKIRNNVLQQELFYELNEVQQRIIEFIRDESGSDIDKISENLNIPVGRLSCELLDLELKGALRCLPGKVYKAL
ncbi:DNA-processing protein DprA [Odoribacter sp. OttesenSCG-928-L07]|nr:DNA-processing protein DprA [Odoribacter sp. OttesenSCG-928-L07]MDL2239941.1 DNA-processing protein DprA [Bacteroidales bacterium OttesenSCG-928-L14]